MSTKKDKDELNPYGIEAIEACPGGEASHIDMLDELGGCAWCGLEA